MPRNVAAVNSTSNHPSALQSSRHFSRNNGRQFDHGKHPSNETMRESEEGETVVGSNPGTMKKGHTRRASSITAFLSIFAFPGRRRRTDSTASEKAPPVLPVTIHPPPTSPTSSSDSPPLTRGPFGSPAKKNPLRSVSVPAESCSASEAERRPARRFPYLHPLLSRRRADSKETVTASDSGHSKGKARAMVQDGGNFKEARSRGIDVPANHFTTPILPRPVPQQKIVSNLNMHVDRDVFPSASFSGDDKAALDRFYAKQERLAGVKRSASFSKPLPSIPIPAPTSPHGLFGLRGSFARSSTHLDAQGSLLPSSAATFGMPSTTSLALTAPDEESRGSMAVYSIGDPRRSAGMPDDEFINVTPSIEVHELESAAVPIGAMATSFGSGYASMSGLPSDSLALGVPSSSAYGTSIKPPSSYSHSQPSRTRKPSTVSISERVKHQPSLGSMATAAGVGSSNSGQSHSRMKKLSIVSLAGEQKSLPPPFNTSNIVPSSQQHPPRRSAKSLSKPSMSAFGIASPDAVVPQERSRSPATRPAASHPTPGVIPKSKSYAEFKSKTHYSSKPAFEPPLPVSISKTGRGKSKTESTAQEVPPPSQSQPLHHRQSSRQLQQPIRRLPSISSVAPPPQSTFPAQNYQSQYPLSYQAAPSVNWNQPASQPQPLRRSQTVPEPSISPVPLTVELAPPPLPKASGRTSRSSSIPNSAASSTAPWSNATPAPGASTYSTIAPGQYAIPPIPPEPVPRSRPVSKRSLPALPSARSQVGWGR
ncbi:hypothetical protein FRC04_004730 [Tulasnella sp. 424]|nr:hypothetical protein FRC04_004730 [Tulasnella sp. 424]KAG8976335.1 hypothetical protein FRC05_004251 [Tulasnella sp. 425]